MHWHHTPAFEAFLRKRGFQVVVTARHPLDVLISILHFAPLEPATARWLEGECGNEKPLIGADPASASFANYCLSDRTEALLSVSREWRNVAEAVIRFEDLLAAPVAVCRQMLQGLKAEPLAGIEEVVAANTVEKLRPISATHVWRGQAGSWKAVITPALANKILERHRPYFDDLQYNCDPSPDLDASTARQNWDQMASEGVVRSSKSSATADPPPRSHHVSPHVMEPRSTASADAHRIL